MAIAGGELRRRQGLGAVGFGGAETETDGDGRGGEVGGGARPAAGGGGRIDRWEEGKPRAAGNACATLAGITRELSVM